jgi:hypothetical protein
VRTRSTTLAPVRSTANAGVAIKTGLRIDSPECFLFGN